MEQMSNRGRKFALKNFINRVTQDIVSAPQSFLFLQEAEKHGQQSKLLWVLVQQIMQN